MDRTLEGIRVVDLSQNLAGPFCTQTLADLGAEVVKVEPPSGDSARAWGPPFWGPHSTLFLSGNRGKRSVVLDLTNPGGREVLHRMIGEADVFVAAFRSGVAERLGCGPDEVRRLNRRIIYLSVTAYGSEGPLKDQPGYDPLMQAYAGIMSMTGHPDRPPARVGASVIDIGTGIWSALGILAALRERDRTGEGTHLVTSLLDTALCFASYKITGYLASGVLPRPMGSGFGSIAPYEAFPTREGHVMIAAANDRIFTRLCRALELPAAMVDERFQDNPSRVRNRDALFLLVADRTRTFGSAELLTLLQEHSVPASPIHDVSDLIDDPQVAASEMLRKPPHPSIPSYRDLAFPVKMGGARPVGPALPPALGEHTEEVLVELGFDPDTIEELRRTGALGPSRPEPE